jgi:cytochrome c peroxidase
MGFPALSVSPPIDDPDGTSKCGQNMNLGNAAGGRSVGYTGLSAIIALVSFAQISFGAAIVGETRAISDIPDVMSDIDSIKVGYQRPQNIPFPEDNPYTLKKALLGQRLFFDKRLSNSSAQSCASCHDPGYGWGDGLPVGVGYRLAKLARRSPSIVNAAWGATYMWDSRAANLEDQAIAPIQSAVEMNMPLAVLLKRLGTLPQYNLLFEAAFPNEGLSATTLAKALATYERTIVSEQAPFDVWINGDEGAISERAKRGFAIFNTKGHCSSCHEGWNFTNDGFQDIGLSGTDTGRGQILPQVAKMSHAFKTPGLREIASRGPYMHDGSIGTLEAVIEHYDRGGIDRPSRSDLIVPLGLTVQDKLDLVAFLQSLSSKLTPTALPVFPR